MLCLRFQELRFCLRKGAGAYRNRQAVPVIVQLLLEMVEIHAVPPEAAEAKNARRNRTDHRYDIDSGPEKLETEACRRCEDPHGKRRQRKLRRGAARCNPVDQAP